MDSQSTFIAFVPYALGVASLLLVACLAYFANKVKASRDVDTERRRAMVAERGAAEAEAEARELKEMLRGMDGAAKEARRKAEAESRLRSEAEAEVARKAAEAKAMEEAANGASLERERAKRAARVESRKREDLEAELKRERLLREKEMAHRADFRFSASESLKGWVGANSRHVPSLSGAPLCEKKDFFFRFQIGLIGLHSKGLLGITDSGMNSAKRAIWRGDLAGVAKEIAAGGGDAQAAKAVVRTLAVAALRGAAEDAGRKCDYSLYTEEDDAKLSARKASYQALRRKIGEGVPLDEDDERVLAKYEFESRITKGVTAAMGNNAWVFDCDAASRSLSVGVSVAELFSNRFARLVASLAGAKKYEEKRFLI